MILNYKSRKKSLTQALTEIQTFEDKMVIFIEKYPYYSYKLNINKEEIPKPLWVVDLNITRNERKINKDTA